MEALKLRVLGANAVPASEADRIVVLEFIAHFPGLQNGSDAICLGHHGHQVDFVEHHNGAPRVVLVQFGAFCLVEDATGIQNKQQDIGFGVTLATPLTPATPSTPSPF